MTTNETSGDTVTQELLTAQQQFDRDMDAAKGDHGLETRAQVRHNGRVWGAAMARFALAVMELQDVKAVLRDHITAGQERSNHILERLASVETDVAMSKDRLDALVSPDEIRLGLSQLLAQQIQATTERQALREQLTAVVELLERQSEP